MTIPYTLENLLVVSLELEKRAYAFYDSLVERYADNEELVETLQVIRRDEKEHISIVEAITAALSPGLLSRQVPPEEYQTLARVVEYMRDLNLDSLETSDDVCEAIRTLERIEFDTALSFLDIEDIKLNYTSEYIRNQSVAHTNLIYKALQLFD